MKTARHLQIATALVVAFVVFVAVLGEAPLDGSFSSEPAPCINMQAKKDGFGAQYEALLSGFSFALLQNFSFCGSHWAKMAHGANPSEMFRFIGGPRFNSVQCIKCNPRRSKKGKSFEREMGGRYGEVPRAAMLAREFYFSTPKPPLEWFSPIDERPQFNLAVHVRRGDVAHGRNGTVWGYRFVPDEDYVHSILRVLRNEPSCSRGNETSSVSRACCRVHIFSDDTMEQLGNLTFLLQEAILSEPGVEVAESELHQQAKIKSTFHHMVMADSLITAPSSFSWAAAFLHKKGEVHLGYKTNIYSSKPALASAWIPPAAVEYKLFSDAMAAYPGNISGSDIGGLRAQGIMPPHERGKLSSKSMLESDLPNEAKVLEPRSVTKEDKRINASVSEIEGPLSAKAPRHNPVAVEYERSSDKLLVHERAMAEEEYGSGLGGRTGWDSAAKTARTNDIGGGGGFGAQSGTHSGASNRGGSGGGSDSRYRHGAHGGSGGRGVGAGGRDGGGHGGTGDAVGGRGISKGRWAPMTKAQKKQYA